METVSHGHRSLAALLNASQAGDLAEMGRLLDGGAEADAFVAAPTPDGDICQCTALCEAANHGQLDAVRLLLDRGADPSLADSLGVTPLMTAVAGAPRVMLVGLFFNRKIALLFAGSSLMRYQPHPARGAPAVPGRYR
jgi:hypothetical protein